MENTHRQSPTRLLLRTVRDALGWGCLFAVMVLPAAAGDAPTSAAPKPRRAAERLGALERSSTDITHALDEIEAILKATPTLGAEQSSLVSKLQEKEQERDRLKARIQELKAALKQQDGEPQSAEELQALRTRAAELSRWLEALRREQAFAQQDLERQRANTTSSGRGAKIGKISWERREQLRFVLVGKRVIPLKEPYFKLERDSYTEGNYRYTYVTKATRQQDGESIEQAIASSGCLAQALDEASPSTHGAQFFVCPDAVPTYRIAAEYAKSKNFKLYWIPHDDKPLQGGRGGGGRTPGM